MTWRTRLAAATVRLLECELEWPRRLKWPYRLLARSTGACPRCYHRWNGHFPACDRPRIKRHPERPWANRS